ncbi:MAG: hypothetical protein A4E25_00004 [Methanobacterium sp. PtaB.Bin024]|jgi:hypothetical protein|nr:MAG: hypothetical protein A4E25_00004 [Methanobacterium sp. PtaB.Bin024]
MKSTIYLKCPQCRKKGLLIERQGKYFCANCMYDYTPLKDDPGRLDEILIENLQEEGFGPLFATALYERVTLTPPKEANEYIMKLAEENNIQIMPGKMDVVKSFTPLFIIIAIVVVIIIIAFIFISTNG